MEIHLIWAQDRNNAIGVNGNLPWNIPEDLKNFKKLTLNKPIIMGRKTWDSLKFKPLPKRRNIVLSSKQKIDNAEIYKNIHFLLNELIISNIKSIFIIGGAQVYKEFWNLATHLHITLISKNCENADTFFPIKYNMIEKEFKKINSENLTNIAEYQLWTKI
tara:strand:- start:5297 stop:5779 length:483 start_codon:yes stop_codon:yes gene_type:complete